MASCNSSFSASSSVSASFACFAASCASSVATSTVLDVEELVRALYDREIDELVAATNAAGRRVKVRGTSFATPLVSSRVALKWGAGMGLKLDAEAIDLGARGPDGTYGRGLLCTICRPAQ